MFGKDLVVMAKYDESKLLEEMDFSYIQIWVRAMKMPLGEMNRTTGVGQFLRIKVRLDIRKPLMRGVMLFVRKDDKPVWCPLVYEFLPDFYTCGIIGHTDKVCETRLNQHDAQQYSRSLRFIPGKRRGEEGSSDRFRVADLWRRGV